MHDLTTIDVLLRLSLALAFGTVIGLERERKDRPAGLRTNMLVALGSAAFTVVAIAMMQQYTILASEPIQVDPIRIVAGIVGGVGFLGAGAILHREDHVRGMTTAAGIWVVAAVGIASGAGYFMIAGVCVSLAIFTLIVVRWAESTIRSRKPHAPQPSGSIGVGCDSKTDPTTASPK